MIEPKPIIETRLIIRAGIVVVSVLGHVALLTWSLVFADGHPFEPGASTAISVEIVPPNEMTRAVQKAAQESAPSSQTEEASSAEETSNPAATTALPGASADESAMASAPQSQPPQSQSVAPIIPAPTLASLSGPPVVEPDLTEKFGTLFGLPSGDFGSPASEKANIPSTATMREHLKTCSKLPKSIAPGDKVKIILRVVFRPDGRFAAPPALIEASASAKGPALMQSAIEALQACQPYAMLPADQYNEWKVLDLSFTPQDFVGG
jgi:hypothetical protein